MKRAVLTLLLATAAAVAEPPRVPTLVATATVHGAALRFDGVLQPVRQATVTAQVGGNVLALRVKAGDVVRRGQPIATLDGREMRAGVARGDAGIAQADAALRNAQLALRRNEDLARAGFVSTAAVDNAQTQVKAALAGLAQASAERRLAAVAQGHTELLAPFDGIVLATHAEAGDLALPGRAIATLYEPGKLRAVVQLPASRSADASAAMDIGVTLPDGRQVTPISRELLPGADPVSQTIEWRLVLPAEAASARPGQAVTVRTGATVATGAPKRIVLPAAAILRRGELTAVYVASGSRFVLRAVRVGPPVGDSVEVLAGLTAQERVAADAVRAGLAGALPK